MPEIGQTISHYRILEKIGVGGMGEVYLADDLSLDRKVALKFLPDIFTGDPERMARFEREAKLLASLNHPNIAAIYGLEKADGKRFLIMEYVEGETLQARISKGALPLEEALAVCRQIAEGLEAAHEKGVIHRDLKPANVMITGEEKVKILDFGLAKALLDEGKSVDSSQSPTITEAMTQPGVVLGTAAYMSPEQAKGKAVDKRADIWAFGCILYECLTGKKAFGGETVTEMLAAVIKEEPDFEKAPLKFRLLLKKCLAKDRKDRLRDIGDYMVWIETVAETLQYIPHKKPILTWTSIALFLCLCVVIAALLIFRDAPNELPVRRFSVLLPKGSEYIPSSFVSISPDGNHIAFFANSAEGKSMLFIRPLDSLESKPLTEGDFYSSLIWSPDSRQIAYTFQGKLKKVNLSEGRTQTLCNSMGMSGGSWNEDGDILFTNSIYGPIYRTSETGDKPVPVTIFDESQNETGHAWPQFLPDNRHFLYLAISGSTENRIVKIGSMDSKETRVLFPSSMEVVYVDPGYLLFVRESTLIARSFNPGSLELYRDEISIADGIATSSFAGKAGFSVSQSGVLAYVTEESLLGQLQWYDRDGRLLETVGPPGYYTNPSISPDDKQIAVDKYESLEVQPDIFIFNLSRPGDYGRFTSIEGFDSDSIWSPNGKLLAFSSLRESARDLYAKNLTGAGGDALLFKSEDDKYVSSWTRDGKQILVTVRTKTARPYDLWVLDISNENKAVPYLKTEFSEGWGQFSPDGKWVAYVSDELGQSDIYVNSYPNPGKKYRISNSGGSQPKWSSDGKEIYYLALDHKIMAVPVETSPNFDYETPDELFDIQLSYGLTRNNYDVSSDGQRFLVVGPPEEGVTAPINVILNWTSLLKQ